MTFNKTDGKNNRDIAISPGAVLALREKREKERFEIDLAFHQSLCAVC